MVFGEGWDLPWGTAPFSGTGHPRQAATCGAAHGSAIWVPRSVGLVPLPSSPAPFYPLAPPSLRAGVTEIGSGQAD